MQHERRCATAVLVAIVVTGLSMLAPLAMEIVTLALFLVALGLVVYATAAEDGSVPRVRRSAAVCLACAVLGTALFISGPFASLALRALGAAALVDALALWRRTRGLVPTAHAGRSSPEAAP